MLNDVERVLLSEEQLDKIVSDLGARISEDYKGKDLLLVGVLKGSIVTMADLMRKITVPCCIDFMVVSSYGSGTKTSGVVKIIKDLDAKIEGRHVLIIEDILDSGLTLTYLTKLLSDRNAASVKVCTLLNKPDRRDPSVTLVPDYVGADIPDEFVIGYGLDHAEKYRNLPFVGILKKELQG